MKLTLLSILAFILFYSCSYRKQDTTQVSVVDKKEQADTTKAPIRNDVPSNGRYEFDAAFAEWQGKSMGEKVLVIINSNTIQILFKGKLIDEGQLMKHKTGVWIIGSDKSDTELDEVGGCTDGPSVIDFIKKQYWMC